MAVVCIHFQIISWIGAPMAASPHAKMSRFRRYNHTV